MTLHFDYLLQNKLQLYFILRKNAVDYLTCIYACVYVYVHELRGFPLKFDLQDICSTPSEGHIPLIILLAEIQQTQWITCTRPVLITPLHMCTLVKWTRFKISIVTTATDCLVAFIIYFIVGQIYYEYIMAYN